ncbi:transposase [Streptomyces sp. NBC_01235]|uniref:transposase n=1 Tax=Streptomyces sp. NBC_01235 TaxID=2903788 RepID=UPI002E1136A5|nr:transposase [Streptomyces sp. NBC_01235]
MSPRLCCALRTIDRWRPEISAFIDTGHSNAKSKGINRVIKLVARAAFGFRNADNQRLRTCCVTTRRARGYRSTLRTSILRQPHARCAFGKGMSHRACQLLRGPVGYLAQKVFVL